VVALLTAALVAGVLHDGTQSESTAEARPNRPMSSDQAFATAAARCD
jgi:hypothetical protein